MAHIEFLSNVHNHLFPDMEITNLYSYQGEARGASRIIRGETTRAKLAKNFPLSPPSDISFRSGVPTSLLQIKFKTNITQSGSRLALFALSVTSRYIP